MMPFFSVAIRTAKGVIEGKQLQAKKDGLFRLTSKDTLALVPQSYRCCAELRLKIAKSRAGIKNYAAGEIAREFEGVREKGFKMMMEQASRENATKDEIIRIVHTLKEYAGEAQTSINSVESAAKREAAELRQCLRASETKVQALDAATRKVAADMAQRFSASDKSIQKMAETVTQRASEAKKQFALVGERLDTHANRLNASAKGIRIWLIALGSLSLLQSIGIVYMLLK